MRNDSEIKNLYLWKFSDIGNLEKLKKRSKQLFFIDDEKKILDQIPEGENIHKVFLGTYFQKEILNELSFFSLFEKADFLSEKQDEKFQYLRKTFFRLKEKNETEFFIFKDFGIEYFKNFYKNLFKIKRFIPLKNFKNHFRDIPALILGAGKSLQDPVKDRIKNKALVFSGGTSLCSNEEIHFSAGLDNRFPERLFYHNQEEKIFFHPLKASYNIFSSHHYFKHILTNGSSPIFLEECFLKKLNCDLGDLKFGYNVSTFLLEIALFLGCRPIYLLGVDLSYEKSKYRITDDQEKYELIEIKNKKGVKTYTQKDWLLAKKWIEQKALKYPYIYDLSKEGILDLPNFKEFESLKEMDIDGLIHQKISTLKEIELPVSRKKEGFLYIKKELQRLYDKIQKVLKTGKNFLQKEDIYILQPLWKAFYPILKSRIQFSEDEEKLHEAVFYHRVVEEHLKLIEEIESENVLYI